MVSLVFNVPLSFFAENECLHFSLAPLFTAMIILNFYLQTCRLWLFCAFKSSSRPFLPSLILLVDGEPCFQCPTVFFCKKMSACIFPGPPVYSNDYSE
jgi:hypothetical protein